MMEVKVSGEVFKKIKYMRNSDFNEYLRFKLKSLSLSLQMCSKKSLKRRIARTERIIEMMKREIPELENFYNKASDDRDKMAKWLSILDEENEDLLGSWYVNH